MESSPPPGPLDGTLVVDLATDHAELAGRLLADLGAEVIKVEPPGGVASRRRPPFIAGREGDPEASLYWAAVGLNKKSVVLDFVDRGDLERLARLMAAADIVVESFDPGRMSALGLGYEDIRRRNPRIIYVSVTPYGQTGPKASWPGTDLTSEAAGGLLNLQGDRDRPPIPVGYPQAAFHAGAQAAADAVIALHERELSGLGQHLDVSMQTAMVWTLMNATGFPPNVGTDPPGWGDERDGPTPEIVAGVSNPRRVWECADGHVVFSPGVGGLGGRTLHLFVSWMQTERALEPSLCGRDWVNWGADVREGRLEAEVMNRLFAAVQAFIRTKTKRQLMDRAVIDALLLAPVYTVEDIAGDPQLAARDFWTEVDGSRYPGVFARTSRNPVTLRTRAPRVGEHQQRLVEILRSCGVSVRTVRGPTTAGPRRPFAGTRVADFAWIGAAPIVTKHLADHGATVVHIESSLRPDILRLLAPAKDGVPGLDRSQFMANFNTSKLGLALDLTTGGGYELARRVVDWADIVVESFTPGTMKKLGLDWETLSADRPDLIMMSSCLRGQTGPERVYGGFGGQGAALAGFQAITGWPDRLPEGPWGAYTDFIAPHYSIPVLVGAMLERRRSGLGQYIDLSQVECGLHFIEPLLLDYFENGRVAPPAGLASQHSAPHGVFACAGHERYIAIEVRGAAQWRALCATAGLVEFEDPQYDALEVRRAALPVIDAALAAWCREIECFEAEVRLASAGVPAAVVQRPTDLYRDTQLAHRRFFVTCHHAVMGPTPYDGPITLFSDTPARLRAAPCLGEHTERVLSEILGLTGEQIAQYAAAGCLT